MCLKALKSCFSSNKAKKKSSDDKKQQNPSVHNQNSQNSGNSTNVNNNTNNQASQNSVRNNNNSLSHNLAQNLNNFNMSQEEEIPKVELVKDNRIKIISKYESKDVEFIEYITHPRDKKTHPYLCPICFRNFKVIMQSDCCKNYICHLCAEDLNLRLQIMTNIIPRCHFCNCENKLCYNDVAPGEAIKTYTDSPFNRSWRSSAKLNSNTNNLGEDFLNDMTIFKKSENTFSQDGEIVENRFLRSDGFKNGNSTNLFLYSERDQGYSSLSNFYKHDSNKNKNRMFSTLPIREILQFPLKSESDLYPESSGQNDEYGLNKKFSHSHGELFQNDGSNFSSRKNNLPPLQTKISESVEYKNIHHGDLQDQSVRNLRAKGMGEERIEDLENEDDLNDRDMNFNNEFVVNKEEEGNEIEVLEENNDLEKRPDEQVQGPKTQEDNFDQMEVEEL